MQAEKAKLEQELLVVNSEKEQLIETVLKPAQQSLSENNAKHQRLEAKYEQVCELLELDTQSEWGKLMASEKKKIEEASKKAAEPIPAESAEKPAETKK